MKKQALIAILLCFLMFAGLASVGSSYPSQAATYTAKISLTGTIQLGWYNWTSQTFETFNVSIAETNFTANVPQEIAPGQYVNSTFEGYARMDETNTTQFFGVIHVNDTSPGFMVSFTVPYSLPQVDCFTLEAFGTIETTITQIQQPTIQYTLVRLVGPVTQYGNENVTGWISARAVITNTSQTAKVHIFWMPMPPITPGRSTPLSTNFTYSFYHAMLISASKVAVNYTGYEFYVNGTWTVENVTFTYSGQHFDDCRQNVTVVKTNATGQLMVSGVNFTVSIAGFNDLTGPVWRLDIWHVSIAAWCLDGDVSGPNGVPDGKVDIYDLVAVARHIGETPGFGQGSCNLQQVEQYDVNYDFQVNVYSLVTVAAEIGP